MASARRTKPLFALLTVEKALVALVFIFLQVTMYMYIPPAALDPAYGMDELMTLRHRQLLEPLPPTDDMKATIAISAGQGAGSDSEGLMAGDFLRDPLLHPSNLSQRLPLTRNVEYLGLLLDAGRHYFPVEWIYNLIDYLELLHFNLLHFRLTDDQAFNVRLDSHPELAQPAPGSGGLVYTPTELRDLVQYAKSKNIVIMPEINVPGHAGGFAGSIPNLVVPCVGFICNEGYGVPLNVSHPDLIPLLRDVLLEVKDIFSTAPFFHLGGDELEVSRDCFTELNVDILDYNKFEVELGKMLLDIGIDHDRIVRWEMTGQSEIGEVKTRIKGIDHYWLSRGYEDESDAILSPVICSEGLYFDKGGFDDAHDIYEKTRTMLEVSRKPTVIIAATFELGVKFWLDRKVVGRLLAVSMGASDELYTTDSSFDASYQRYCSLLDLPGSLCEDIASNMSNWLKYKEEWKVVIKSWREDLCDRLSTREMVPWSMKCAYNQMETNQNPSEESFFGISSNETTPSNSVAPERTEDVRRPRVFDKIANHKIQNTGIMLDLVQANGFSHQNFRGIHKLIEYLAKLGFNMLQLRVVSDVGFALSLDKNWSFSSYDDDHVYNKNRISELVKYASTHGIHVMPELSIAHRAGGWLKAAPIAPCPRHFCEGGGAFALNTANHDIFPSLVVVLRALRKTFTSSFVHLGYDERKDSLKCMEEAGIIPDYDSFEIKIETVLEATGYPVDKVLRWENEEQTRFDSRAGAMTHFRLGMPPSRDAGGDYFLSTGLHLDNASSNLFTAWDIYNHVQNMTLYNPAGIIAPVTFFQDEALEFLNVRQRLLAVAIGLSMDSLNDTEFRSVFQELCEATREKNCSLFGRIQDPEKASRHILDDSMLKRKQLCDREVFTATMARPKEGVLVENGTNVDLMAVGLRDELFMTKNAKLCPRKSVQSKQPLNGLEG